MNAKFGNRSSEKRFFDPKTVLDRDEGGELEQRDYELGEFEKDLESGRNMKAAKRRDQLDNSVSAWNNKLSTSRFDYDDANRNGFATLFADRLADHPKLGSQNPEVWDAYFNTGKKVFDFDQKFVNSDEGKNLQSENFEYQYAHGTPDEDAEKDVPHDDTDAWERAGYQSGDMFGEAIDKLAKVSGQYALCEAVKNLYKICTESDESDVPFELLYTLEDKLSYLGKLVQRMDNLLIMHPQYDAAYRNDPWTLKENQQKWSNAYGQAAWNKLSREIERKGALITATDCKEIAAKIDAQIAKVQGLLKKFETH